MNVYVLVAEHPTVPGVVQKVFASRDSAVREAVELLTIMRDDDLPEYADAIPVPTARTWEATLEALEEIHGAAYVCCEISKHSVQS